MRYFAMFLCLASCTIATQFRAQPTGPLPEGALADYQLGGAYSPPEGVNVVVRDSTAQPEPGLFNICYVNGFQTQPGAEWPTNLLVKGSDGAPLQDEGWPDEFLFDISTDESREANLAQLLPTIRLCADKGFDAVEFDNLDAYTRSDDRLSVEDTVAFAKMLVGAADDMGLPAGQKNTGDLGARGRDEVGYVFAVTEECYRWSECDSYTGVYGASQVIGIEYTDDLRGSFKDACAAPDRPVSMILRDRLLVGAGAEDYAFDACR